MQTIIKAIKAKSAARRELNRKLEALTDPHFFTIAAFASAYEFNTGNVTAADCDTTRALL